MRGMHHERCPERSRAAVPATQHGMWDAGCGIEFDQIEVAIYNIHYMRIADSST